MRKIKIWMNSIDRKNAIGKCNEEIYGRIKNEKNKCGMKIWAERLETLTHHSFCFP